MSERCKEFVSRGRMNVGQCSRNAVRDGYCNQHHPDTEKAKRAVWDAQWAAERAARELAANIEKAERAIVEAADALRSEVDGECVALFARRQEELFRAVDAWRKLRGEG